MTFFVLVLQCLRESISDELKSYKLCYLNTPRRSNKVFPPSVSISLMKEENQEMGNDPYWFERKSNKDLELGEFSTTPLSWSNHVLVVMRFSGAIPH